MELIEGIDYYVYRVRFPNTANPACTLVNDDGTYSVYLNTRFTDVFLQIQLRHELRHIAEGHFESNMPISLIELRAEGVDFIRPVLQPPAGYIPCFRSPTAMARWLAATIEVLGVEL